jgi:hypothetical protein
MTEPVNGDRPKRHRTRKTEKLTQALETITRALAPFDAETRNRLLRSAAAFHEIDLATLRDA